MTINKRNLIIFITLLILVAGILVFFYFSNSKDDKTEQTVSWNDGNWSIFRGNPQLTGFVDEKMGENLVVKWTLPLDDAIVSTPVIADGILYTISQSGSIYAISLEKQSILWKKVIDDGFEASPILKDGFLYIGSLSGIFFKIDISDGSIIWKKDIGTRIAGSANFLLSEIERIFFGCYDSHFYALNTKNGEIVTKIKVKSYINGAPAVNNNDLAFGSCDGNLYLVDGVIGKEKAAYKFGNYIAGSPVIHGNSVTAATYDGTVKSFDLKTNKLAWKWNAPSDEGFISSPATDGKTLVQGNKDGSIYALNAENGNFKWDFKTGDAVEASALIIGDKVCVGSTDGYFYILNLAEGKEIQSFALLGIPVSAASWYKSFVYVITDNGFVYCIGD